MSTDDQIVFTMECKTILTHKIDKEMDVNVVHVYELESTDMAGIHPGHAVVFGQIAKE